MDRFATALDQLESDWLCAEKESAARQDRFKQLHAAFQELCKAQHTIATKKGRKAWSTALVKFMALAAKQGRAGAVDAEIANYEGLGSPEGTLIAELLRDPAGSSLEKLCSGQSERRLAFIASAYNCVVAACQQILAQRVYAPATATAPPTVDTVATRRPCYERDHQLLQWKRGYIAAGEKQPTALARRRWNGENPKDTIEPEAAKKGIQKAERESKQSNGRKATRN